MGKKLILTGLVCAATSAFLSCEHNQGTNVVTELAPPGNLDILRTHWSHASQPGDGMHDYKNKANNFIWYNPFGQTRVQDIYPEREADPNVPNRVNILTFEFFLDAKLPQQNPLTWGGVMRVLPAKLLDQSQTRFIEIIVQGDRGRLHVDLGSISEDVIPNGRLDTEDRPVNGVRDGIAEPDEDVGLDGERKPDPPSLNFPRDNFVGQSTAEIPYDFWDVNSNGRKDEDEPWSYDDWSYTEQRPFVYIQADGKGSISGTEGNAVEESGLIADSEDLNRNNAVDLVNQYLSFSFSLSKSSPDTALVVGGNPDKGWFIYRVPFSSDSADAVVGGRPELSNIEFVRVWFDQLSSNGESDKISIAQINFVDSE